MRGFALFLIALGIGALTVSGQEDRREELERKIEELRELLEQENKKREAPQDNFIIRRTYEVADIVQEIRDTLIEPTNVVPSKLNLPEREVAEPCRPFEIDMLMEVIRQTVEPDSWDEIEGADIQPRNGYLFVTNVARAHTGIARLLAQVREVARRQVIVDVVALPVGKQTAALLGQRPRELTPEQAKALAAVQPLGRARLICLDGQASAQRSGRKRNYLGDYDVEIAPNSSIGDPRRKELFAGFAAEVRTCMDAGAQGVTLHCRIERTQLGEPMRRVDTEHGPIDLPEMTLTRVNTSLWAPLGRTVVAGGCTVGKHPCVFLLTPRLAR